MWDVARSSFVRNIDLSGKIALSIAMHSRLLKFVYSEGLDDLGNFREGVIMWRREEVTKPEVEGERLWVKNIPICNTALAPRGGEYTDDHCFTPNILTKSSLVTIEEDNFIKILDFRNF